MFSDQTPRRIGRGSSLAALVLVASIGRSALAAPISYQYGGVITSADPSTGIAAGTPFSGTFTYDPIQSSGGLGYEGYNQYNFGKSLSYGQIASEGAGFSLQVGGTTVLANAGGVSLGISELEYPGQWGYRSATGPAGPSTRVSISNNNIDGNPLLVDISLSNPSRSVFGSLAPPTTLNLADFTQANLSVTELTNPGSKVLYSGTIDTLRTVPEPASTTLICLVAAGWLAHSRRLSKAGEPSAFEG